MQKVKKSSELRVKALRNSETIRLLETPLLPSYFYIKQPAPTQDTQQHSRLEG